MENLPKAWSPESVKSFSEQTELATSLIEKHPGLDSITALILAGDKLSYKRALELVDSGTPVLKASIMVGSFSRFDFLVEQYYAGNLTEEEFFPEICAIWRGADPNDTDQSFLQVWNEAWEWNNNKTLFDEKPLPDEEKEFIIYRGQLSLDEPMGIAWSIDKKVAEKFSHGASVRVYTKHGVLLTAKVKRESILAYITGRGEEEIIVDPEDVTLIETRET